jgi:putative Mg2+ transporter-C (MgtC) family protein
MPRLLVVPDLLAPLSTVLRLAVAFGLGTLIGFERQWRQHAAGLRTNVLVATGAAAFADLGLRLRGAEGRRASSPTSCRASGSLGPA